MSANILLPDAIFEYDADGSRRSVVGRFTYEKLDASVQQDQFAFTIVEQIEQ